MLCRSSTTGSGFNRCESIFRTAIGAAARTARVEWARDQFVNMIGRPIPTLSRFEGRAVAERRHASVERFAGDRTVKCR
jgi:hypothetical protein